ncbi:hypothetical protein BKA67DRAFT_654697 [Truncatella angustata]|uniref:Uncharacterized protein n=1 Tax=Truncatella angustata TaxID=152316 RepID=A0A9P8UQ24_9PEZI|nr:uncharacterized protein BKA67DRAFT_654697 [Truncatella angustata]KAH6656352.1 hypothetical protein BKA67DRAFT_654697 [Truncatella angustata]KAH8198515.1 hypothetical protein TruAng_007294 [Truncatella angustata]
MRNPFLVAREWYQRTFERPINMRDAMPLTGFLLIILVALLAIICMVPSFSSPRLLCDGMLTNLCCSWDTAVIYGITLETTRRGLGKIDVDDGEPPRPDVSMADKLLVDNTTADGRHALPVATETVFSTSTVHVTLASTTTASPASTKSTAHSSVTIHSQSTTSGPATTASADVVTGEMFCPATDRPHNVYTPCLYTHTNQPGMVNTTALPNAGVATSDARRRAANPLACTGRRAVDSRRREVDNPYRESLPSFFAAVYELSWRVPRLAKVVVLLARQATAELIHPDPDSLAKLEQYSGCLGVPSSTQQLQTRVKDLEDRNYRLQNSIRSTQEQLQARVNGLEDKNRRLAEGIHNAQDVVQMQQGLLDSQLRIIEKQRIQIEEATRFKIWWAKTQNQTGEYHGQVPGEDESSAVV